MSQRFHTLCQLHELVQNNPKGFQVTTEQGMRQIFVVRTKTALHAYENQCPHTGAPLDWQPDAFLDQQGTQIICAMHGARFRIEDGYCVSGPCVGASLQTLAVSVVEHEVRIFFDTN